MKKTIVTTCEYCGQEFDAIQKYSSHKRHEHPGWREGLLPRIIGVNGMPQTSEEEQSAQEQVEADTGLNYCPSCGLDIGRLGRMLRDAKSALDYCPQCGIDLLKVRQALEGLSAGAKC